MKIAEQEMEYRVDLFNRCSALLVVLERVLASSVLKACLLQDGVSVLRQVHGQEVRLQRPGVLRLCQALI